MTCFDCAPAGEESCRDEDSGSTDYFWAFTSEDSCEKDITSALMINVGVEIAVAVLQHKMTLTLAPNLFPIVFQDNENVGGGIIGIVGTVVVCVFFICICRGIAVCFGFGMCEDPLTAQQVTMSPHKTS